MAQAQPGGHGESPVHRTPIDSWTRILAGNQRFADGQLELPDLSKSRRDLLAAGQFPYATVFGCSDSRASAELVLGQGLGDLFVVRTAGHVVDSGVLGSLEYSVDSLGVPLIVVMGHSRCGAVRAAAEALVTGKMPGGFVRDLVERVLPALLTCDDTALLANRDCASIMAEKMTGSDFMVGHVQETVKLILQRSVSINRAVTERRCAIVGAMYCISDGLLEVACAHGLRLSDVATHGAAGLPADTGTRSLAGGHFSY